MSKCSYCTKEIESGTGKMYVKTDGKILYFCSHKCQMNLLKLHRNPLSATWSSGGK